MAWVTNLGELPRFAVGRRVRVRLRNGLQPVESWAADGKGGCRWTIEKHPFDIEFFEVI